MITGLWDRMWTINLEIIVMTSREETVANRLIVWEGVLDRPVDAPLFSNDLLRGFEKSTVLANVAWEKAREMAETHGDRVLTQSGALQGKWRGRIHGEPVLDANSTITARSDDGFFWVLIQSHVQVPHESSGQNLCFSVTRQALPVVPGETPQFMFVGGGSDLLEE